MQLCLYRVRTFVSVRSLQDQFNNFISIIVLYGMNPPTIKYCGLMDPWKDIDWVLIYESLDVCISVFILSKCFDIKHKKSFVPL